MTFEESVRETPRRCEEATIWRNCQKKKGQQKPRRKKSSRNQKLSFRKMSFPKRFYSYPTVRGHLLRARLDRIVVLSGPSK